MNHRYSEGIPFDGGFRFLGITAVPMKVGSNEIPDLINNKVHTLMIGDLICTSRGIEYVWNGETWQLMNELDFSSILDYISFHNDVPYQTDDREYKALQILLEHKTEWEDL